MRALSRLERADVFERMIHQYHIPLATVLDAMSQRIARFVCEQYPQRRRTVILAGSGNTGGIGIRLAHILHSSGLNVCLVMTRHELFLKPVAKEFFRQLPEELLIGTSEDAHDDELRDLVYSSNLLIDALVGYSVIAPMRGEVLRLIQLCSENTVPVVAIDIPSGLDADIPVATHVMRANATVTPLLPTPSMLLKEMSPYTGPCFVVDAGMPDIWFEQELIERPCYDALGIAPVVP